MSTTSTRESELATFIEKLVAELAPIELEHNRNYWKLATTGEEQYLAICTKLDSQMRLMFARKEPYEFLKGVAAAGPLGGILDTVVVIRRAVKARLRWHHVTGTTCSRSVGRSRVLAHASDHVTRRIPIRHVVDRLRLGIAVGVAGAAAPCHVIAAVGLGAVAGIVVSVMFLEESVEFLPVGRCVRSAIAFG